MRSLILTVLLLSLAAPNAFAKKNSWIKLALGGKIASGINNRGATYYNGIAFIPVVYLGLGEERVRIFGTSLELLESFMKDSFRVKTRLASLSDEPLFTTGEPKGIRNSRDSALEWTTTFQLFFPSYKKVASSMEASYTKGLSGHKGDYVEVKAAMTVANFKTGMKKLSVAPQLFGTVGYGGVRHNLYQYGATANQAGITNFSAGVQLLLPGAFDPDFPVMSAYYYSVLGSENKSGNLLGGKTSGVFVQLTIAFGLIG